MHFPSERTDEADVISDLVDYLCTRVKEVTGLDMEVFVAPRSLDREIDRMAREEAGLDIDEDAIDNLKKAQVDIAMAFWRNIGFVQAIPESAYSVRLLN